MLAPGSLRVTLIHFNDSYLVRAARGLFVFHDPPRALPPWTEPRLLQGGEELARAARRAAVPPRPWCNARFWREMAAQTSEIEEDVASSDLAQICLAFRQVRITSLTLVDSCSQRLQRRPEVFNVFELAAVASLCASAGPAKHDKLEPPQKLISDIADEVSSDWRRRETVPWTAWWMLVVAAAESGVSHKGLFDVAASPLGEAVRLMSSRHAVKVNKAYAAFGFRHHGLLNELHRFVPAMGLDKRDAWRMQEAFGRLDFDAPLLSQVRELQDLEAADVVKNN